MVEHLRVQHSEEIDKIFSQKLNTREFEKLFANVCQVQSQLQHTIVLLNEST